MKGIKKDIFYRTYQSYLCGSDIYTYKFKTKSINMLKKLDMAVKELEKEDLINIKSKSNDTIKIIITEKGIDYGNSLL